MAAGVRIKLFGHFSVDRDGRRLELGSSPTQQLLARLATAQNSWLERTTLAADLWPDVEFSVSGNRLRTHLVYLKKGLEPLNAVSTDRSRLMLDLTEVDLDLRTAEHYLKQLRIQNNQREERELLRGLLDLIDHDLLEGWVGEWIDPLRAYWRDQRADAYLRLARLSQEDDDLEGALVSIDRALLADPYRSEAWVQFLRVMGRLGRGAHALARFRSARQKMRAELDLDFAEEVLEVSRALGKGSLGPTVAQSGNRRIFTMEERELLIGALERAVTQDPSFLLDLIGHESFRREVYKNPPVGFKLGNSVFDATEGLDPRRVKIIWTILLAGVLVDEHERKLELCHWILDHLDESTHDHWSALSAIAFTKFELREMDEAYAYIEKARLNAVKYDRTYGKVICKAQLGSFYWHDDRLDEAMELYQQAIVEYGQGDDVRQAHNLSGIHINCGFLESLRGNWEACRDWTDKGWRIAVVNGLEGVLHWAFPVMGLAKIMSGDVRAGCRLMIDGVTLCYARRNIRMHEIGMDYAACALAHLGKPREAVALANAYAEFRAKRKHYRSKGELRLMGMFFDPSRSETPNPDWVGRSMSDYILKVCALLESF